MDSFFFHNGWDTKALQIGKGGGGREAGGHEDYKASMFSESYHVVLIILCRKSRIAKK